MKTERMRKGGWWWPTWNRRAHATTLVVVVALVVRLAVGFHSYSGANKPPRFGDYEVQRHWMEVTVNTPVAQWYVQTKDNDLNYWGLDYPPLTAYQSWAFGSAVGAFDPETIALHSSQGIETPCSKALLRWSVVFADIIAYFPALLACVRVFGKGVPDSQHTWLVALVLLQPAALLVDHGHFQFNNINLGLTAAAAAAIGSGYDVAGAVLFSLALNHKQMTLYYAPAFFGHLLGRCLQCKSLHKKLGLAVVATFAVCWAPFLVSSQSALNVLQRLAPLHRGLFEDYVANFWCTTHFLFHWKQRFAQGVLVKLCTGLTVLGCLPSMVQQIFAPSPRGLLVCMANSAMSFFLFSYQVHEKSILLPLLPITLLGTSYPSLAWQLPIVATFSMYPLLQRDGLTIAYLTTVAVYVTLTMSFRQRHRSTWGEGASLHQAPSAEGKTKALLEHVWQMCRRGGPWLLAISGVIVHGADLLVEAPKKYPFLYDLCFVGISFLHFSGLFLYLNWVQWHPVDGVSSAYKQATRKKVEG